MLTAVSRRRSPYYESHEKLVEVDGMGTVEQVAQAIDQALAASRA